ncbi:MAG: nuclease-related domain-containing protein [Nitrospiraceae bacterium]|nr:nuclease-related domain-containing protein [Nitrospiraceae bacterium]
MIIKERDSKEEDIKELTALLSLPLPSNKRFLIERELRFMKSGERGEQDSAYFIDFYHAASKNWVVVHDLRLEHQGRVAQIDHLLINRFFDIYVLETKNFACGIKITDTGEFLVDYHGKYYSIESPIEQNKRHLAVLEEVIGQYDIMPTRLGITIRPAFHCYVLVSPKSRVIRPAKGRFDTSMVIKADELRTAIDKRFDDMGNLASLVAGSKMSSLETVQEATMLLASLHKPIKIDYRKRFGIDDRATATIRKAETKSTIKATTGRFYCFKCRKAITEKVAKFCWDNPKRFGGKAYCFNCQKDFAK